VVNCYSEVHEIESLRRILGVQGLKKREVGNQGGCRLNFEHQFQVRGAEPEIVFFRLY